MFFSEATWFTMLDQENSGRVPAEVVQRFFEDRGISDDISANVDGTKSDLTTDVFATQDLFEFDLWASPEKRGSSSIKEVQIFETKKARK